MRTIKFRGKAQNGRWLVGELLSLNSHKYIAPDDGDWFDFIEWVPENLFHALDSDKYEVDINTIGQFTGLNDSIGKEIYEGDIVKYLSYAREEVGYIGFHACSASFRVIAERTDYGIGNRGELHELELEVIGNIYDDPELLKWSRL